MSEIENNMFNKNKNYKHKKNGFYRYNSTNQNQNYFHQHINKTKTTLDESVINLSLLPTETSVGAIVYNLWDSKVLIIRGLNRFYGFPKGHIEKNETELQTLIRELYEETNLDLNITNYKIIGDKMTQSFYLNKKYYSDGPKEINRVNVFYTIIIFEDPSKLNIQKQPEEILEIDWYTVDKGLELLSKTNSNQLDYLKNGIKYIRNYVANKIMI
jgi:8-oxo-dGTP pyrophosphatase MutT (NUDIX family)